MKVNPPAYKIIRPDEYLLPILLSVPHCGTYFPEDLHKHFDQKHLQYPDDTDWFVDKLYDFAPALGITMIVAQYSRYVIDLNRDPSGKPLYAMRMVVRQLNLFLHIRFLGNYYILRCFPLKKISNFARSVFFSISSPTSRRDPAAPENLPSCSFMGCSFYTSVCSHYSGRSIPRPDLRKPKWLQRFL